jgi:hypothetical protein
MSDGNGNGNGERPNGVQKIAITFTPSTFATHVDFDVMNLDCAHAMLATALRVVEKQMRLASMVEAQQALAAAARDAQIAATLANGGRRA